VSIALTPPADISILNILPARVAEVTAADSSQIDVKLILGRDRGAAIWARLTAHSVHHLQLTVGRDVYALVKAVAIDRQSIAG
jgi:molybdate transport system ATP-binding protein